MAKNAHFNGAARLLVQIAVILVAVAAGWGIVRQQVTVNAANIEKIEIKKLDNEVFKMYCEQQKLASEKIDKALDKIDSKLDKALGGGP